MTDELRIDAILVEDRHRHDLGDIKGLADSIDTLGLIQPVVVMPDNRLVAGERRLAACRSLGWETVPVVVVHTLADAADRLMAERDENTCRKDFTPTEAANMRAAVAAVLAPIAEERKGGRPRKGETAPNLGEVSHDRETGRVAARGLGFSGATLDKVDKVAKVAADDTQPEPVRKKAREALVEMDATNNADKPYKAVKTAISVAELVAQFPDLSYYADQGRDAEVVRLGTALRGYAEPELSVRLNALRASINADPSPPGNNDGPDYVVLGHKVFNAANAAAQAITKAGGQATITAATADADQFTIGLWREQFEALAETCRALAQACNPQLKVVGK